MKIGEKDAQVLQNIVKHCDAIIDTARYFGNTVKVFLKNHIYRSSVSMSLQSIGELTKHLSDEFISRAAEIPWKQIKGQRNIFAHGYDTEVDFSKVWDTVEKDIPGLRKFCAAILLDNGYPLIKIDIVATGEDEMRHVKKGESL